MEHDSLSGLHTHTQCVVIYILRKMVGLAYRVNTSDSFEIWRTKMDVAYTLLMKLETLISLSSLNDIST